MNKSHPEDMLKPGQQWISLAEPELGMGILVSHDKRTMKIQFPGQKCSRRYSIEQAPIKRARFKPGDEVSTLDGQKFRIETAQDCQGLMTYAGQGFKVAETKLAPFMSISLPQERLLAGLSTPPALFSLRQKVLFKRAAYQGSMARGFTGGQVDLIPHQFYIADQVCSRYFPRVLLSDETGLGKTVEAGLILHKLLVTGQIQRILIIVPDALVHQWFVELYRKFGLSFRLFNETLCLETETETAANPFSGDQQGIASLSFIQNHPKRQTQILEAKWDMVVMDEAHHLTDHPGFHAFITRLGKQTQGLMLLTATPEQMGMDTHFAQLRLLDPDRYSDLNTYLKEAKKYEQTARTLIRRMAENKPVDQILDTFGPGRVIFRNRRAAIKGFPQRKVFLVPLEGSKEDVRKINQETNPLAGSRPENLSFDLTQDPRVIYLTELAKTLKPEKLLVICASKQMAAGVEKAVQAHMAIDTVRFDEDMTLIARDRNAAWFARKKGARLMICSEIGSEGRNFQFVHHLFLFDLPLNPELLEQRIGRVDRIGQKKTIQIHVPYLDCSVQEILAKWYNTLGLFEKNINGLHSIFTQFSPGLIDMIQKAKQNGHIETKELDALCQKASEYTQATQKELDKGKHILLELNSFKPRPAKKLIQQIGQIDRDEGLTELMEILLDHYGVDMDPVKETPGEIIYSLTVDHIPDDQFPPLPRNSEFITFDRATAIAREDITFLTWDHPFVNQALDFFIASQETTASTAVLKNADSQGLLLETLFVMDIPGIEEIPGGVCLIPGQPFLIRVDHNGSRIPDQTLPHDFYDKIQSDHPGWFMEMDTLKTQLIPQLVEKSRALAEEDAQKIRSQGIKTLSQTLGREIQRLCELQKINPDIQSREIEAARADLDRFKEKLSSSRIRLDAICLIRTEP